MPKRGGFKGDFKKLGMLGRDLEKLTQGRTMAQLQRKLATGAMAEIDTGFASTKDPDDVPWKPIQHRSGKPLIDTAKMWDGFVRGPVSPNSFIINNRTKYVETHQDGAKIEGPGKFPVDLGPGGKSLVGKGGRRPRRRKSRALARKKRVGDRVWIHYSSIVIAKRRMVPEGSLPKRWLKRWELVVGRHIERIVRDT